MEARAKILGHPVHQFLIVFPLGLLATSFAFDIIRLILGDTPAGWRIADAAFWMLSAGLIGGLVSAPFGLADFLTIPRRTRARRVGAIHGVGNVVVLFLFAVSWIDRLSDPSHPGLTGFFLSLFGVVGAVFTGWLGGELVDRLGVGVHERANLNAPNSLTGRVDRISATGDMSAEEARHTHSAA